MNNKTVEMNTFLELVKSSNNQSEKQYMHKIGVIVDRKTSSQIIVQARQDSMYFDFNQVFSEHRDMDIQIYLV